MNSSSKFQIVALDRQRVTSLLIVGSAAFLFSPDVYCSIDLQAYALSAVAGSPVGGFEAYFSTLDANPVLADFAATINWGDGTPLSTANISSSGFPGAFTVHGDHSYAAAGTYTTSVLVFDFSDSTSATASNTATVQDAPIYATGVYFPSTPGMQFTGAVATFSDSNLFESISDFYATIDWGDGATTLPDNITQIGSSSSYIVQGSHTFTYVGLKIVTIVVSDTGGSNSTATSYSGDRIFADGFDGAG